MAELYNLLENKATFINMNREKSILKILKLLLILCLISTISTVLLAQIELPENSVKNNQQKPLSPISSQSVIDWNSLNRVGINAFSQEKITAIPGIMPVDQNYQLGPGDQVGIYLLGQTHREYNIIINPEGKAYIPSVGLFDFNRHTLSTSKKELKKTFFRFFSEKNLEIMLKQPKQVLLSVVGEINTPGRYSLSGLQTTFDAIYLAGGPKENGSLRKIHIIHGDNPLVKVDLYDLLLKGIGRGGPTLQPGDIIKVLPLISSVSIAGEIIRPGRYELSSEYEETLSDIFKLAAGPSPLAYLERVEISRRQADGRREICFVDAADSVLLSKISLQDGDRIRIYNITEQYQQPTVEIFGEIRRPGKYDLEKSLTLRDLILKAGGVTRSAYLLCAELDRIDPNQPVQRFKFSLEELLSDPNSDQNVLLDEFDRIIIRQIPEWLVGPGINIKGEVMFPGFYSITKDCTKISDILRLAGGFTKDAFLREAKLIRPSTPIQYDPELDRLKNLTRDEMSDLEYEYLVMKQNQDIKLVVVDFYKLWIQKDKSQDMILEHGDIIEIPEAPHVVQVTGRVSNPGGVLFKQDMDIKYYIQKAGGTTWDANRKKTKVIKSSGEILDDEDVKELNLGDVIWVPRKPDRNYWQIFRDTMMVLGQLATIYLVAQNATK